MSCTQCYPNYLLVWYKASCTQQIGYNFFSRRVCWCPDRIRVRPGGKSLAADYSTIHDNLWWFSWSFRKLGGLHDGRRIGKEIALFGCRWNSLRSPSSSQSTEVSQVEELPMLAIQGTELIPATAKKALSSLIYQGLYNPFIRSHMYTIVPLMFAANPIQHLAVFIGFHKRSLF